MGTALGQGHSPVWAMNTLVALLAFVSGLVGGVGLTMLWCSFTREDED